MPVKTGLDIVYGLVHPPAGYVYWPTKWWLERYLPYSMLKWYPPCQRYSKDEWDTIHTELHEFTLQVRGLTLLQHTWRLALRHSFSQLEVALNQLQGILWLKNDPLLLHEVVPGKLAVNRLIAAGKRLTEDPIACIQKDSIRESVKNMACGKPCIPDCPTCTLDIVAGAKNALERERLINFGGIVQ